jgi:plasmid stability protein
MKHLNVRLDDETHARLKAAADRDSRSMNAELLQLLKFALAKGEREFMSVEDDPGGVLATLMGNEPPWNFPRHRVT